jgi:histidyl-tRNA synthetase
LVAQLGGKAAPACGFAMGVERLLVMMSEANLVPAPDVPDVYLVNVGEAAARYALHAAETLRDAGLNVILHAGGGSFKAQMKKADASLARFAVLVGEDEVAAQQVTVKPLRVVEHGVVQCEQQRLALIDAIEFLKG